MLAQFLIAYLFVGVNGFGGKRTSKHDKCGAKTADCMKDVTCLRRDGKCCLDLLLAFPDDDSEDSSEELANCMANPLCAAMMACHAESSDDMCGAETADCMQAASCTSILQAFPDDNSQPSAAQNTACMADTLCNALMDCLNGGSDGSGGGGGETPTDGGDDPPAWGSGDCTSGDSSSCTKDGFMGQCAQEMDGNYYCKIDCTSDDGTLCTNNGLSGTCVPSGAPNEYYYCETHGGDDPPAPVSGICAIDWCETYAGDGVCDDDCNNEACYFDNGDCAAVNCPTFEATELDKCTAENGCEKSGNGGCLPITASGPVCAYENDEACDVPTYCPEGTDVEDCSNYLHQAPSSEEP